MESKLVVFEKAGQPLQFTSCEIPALTEGQVLVKNEYATLCRSDISTYMGETDRKESHHLGA